MCLSAHSAFCWEFFKGGIKFTKFSNFSSLMSQDIQIMCDAFGRLFLTPLIFETVKWRRKKTFKSYSCCKTNCIVMKVNKVNVTIWRPPECDVLFKWQLSDIHLVGRVKWHRILREGEHEFETTLYKPFQAFSFNLKEIWMLETKVRHKDWPLLTKTIILVWWCAWTPVINWLISQSFSLPFFLFFLFVSVSVFLNFPCPLFLPYVSSKFYLYHSICCTVLQGCQAPKK